MIRAKKNTTTESVGEKKVGASWLMSFLRAELIDPAWVFAHANFVLFLTGLALIYIGASYVSLNSVRRLENLEKNIKVLKAISIEQENLLMELSKKGRLESLLVDRGITIASDPPYVMVVSADSLAELY
jgi:hypothetical protein